MSEPRWFEYGPRPHPDRAKFAPLLVLAAFVPALYAVEFGEGQFIFLALLLVSMGAVLKRPPALLQRRPGRVVVADKAVSVPGRRGTTATRVDYTDIHGLTLDRGRFGGEILTIRHKGGSLALRSRYFPSPTAFAEFLATLNAKIAPLPAGGEGGRGPDRASAVPGP